MIAFAEFKNVLEDTIKVAIVREDGVHTGAPVPLVLSSDPLTIRCNEAEPLVDKVQTSRATLRIFVTDTAWVEELYMQEANSIQLKVYRNGTPLWCGWLDMEGLDTIETTNKGQIVGLDFGDFSPLKLERYTTEGIVSMQHILQRTIARLGMPVSTDLAHMDRAAQDTYLNTNLLPDEPTLYDLLELCASATVSTLTQRDGKIKFISPLRVRDAQAKAIKHLYGDSNMRRLGAVYSTINYRLRKPSANDKQGDVYRIEQGVITQETDVAIEGGRVASYKIAEGLRESDHTYKAVAGKVAGFREDREAWEYAVIIEDNDDYLPQHGDKDTTPAIELESGALTTSAKIVNVRADLAFRPLILRDKYRQAETPKWYVICTRIAAEITLLSPTGSEVAWYQSDEGEWQKQQTYTTLSYANDLFAGNYIGNSDIRVTHPTPLISVVVDGYGLDEAKGEGVRIELPSYAEEGCRLRVRLYRSIIGVYDYISDAQKYDKVYRELYYKFGGGEGDRYRFLLGEVTISQAQPESEEVEITAYLDDKITEELEYSTIVGTYPTSGAHLYRKVGDEFKRVERIGDTHEHEHLVFGSLYALYGTRGRVYGYRLKGYADSDLYRAGEELLYLRGYELNVRQCRLNATLQTISRDDYVGKRV